MAGGLGNLRPRAHHDLRRVSELAVCHFGNDCGCFLRAGMAADRLNFRVSAGPHAGQHNLALLLPNVVKLTKVDPASPKSVYRRSEEHTSELQSRLHLVCRLLLEKKKKNKNRHNRDTHIRCELYTIS